jgi:hypothetical protein
MGVWGYVAAVRYVLERSSGERDGA